MSSRKQVNDNLADVSYDMKMLRKALRMSAKELSKIAGLTEEAVRNKECGRTRWKSSEIIQVAVLLPVSFDKRHREEHELVSSFCNCAHKALRTIGSAGEFRCVMPLAMRDLITGGVS